MFKLSAFAFIFVFLILLSFVIICVKEKRTSATVIFSAIITLSIIIGIGVLTFDYVCGEKTIVTTINVDEKNSSLRTHLFMVFPDEQGNKYWGIGSISRVHYGNDIPVRITYLPKTKFVLGIERYVGDVPKIPLLGIEDARNDYIQIHSNGDSWCVACVFVLLLIISFSIPKISLKNFWS